MSEMTVHLKLCLTLSIEKEECEMNGIKFGLVQCIEDQICCDKLQENNLGMLKPWSKSEINSFNNTINNFYCCLSLLLFML